LKKESLEKKVNGELLSQGSSAKGSTIRHLKLKRKSSSSGEERNAQLVDEKKLGTIGEARFAARGEGYGKKETKFSLQDELIADASETVLFTIGIELQSGDDVL